LHDRSKVLRVSDFYSPRFLRGRVDGSIEFRVTPRQATSHHGFGSKAGAR